MESAKQHHEDALSILRSEIGEAKRHKEAAETRKNDDFESLLKMMEKTELFDKKLKGKKILLDFSVVLLLVVPRVYNNSHLPFFCGRGASENPTTGWLNKGVERGPKNPAQLGQRGNSTGE